MKLSLLCILFGVVFTLNAVPSQAQLLARIVPDHDQFLLFEPITASLVMKNTSGRHLELQPENFYFIARYEQNRPCQRLDLPPVIEPIRLAAGETVTHRIDFAKSFRMNEVGPYTVGGRITFLGRTINMPFAYTDLVPGITLKTLETFAGNGANASLRNIELKSLYRDKNQHLFLWISDPVRGLSFGVYDLGPLLSVGSPRLEVGENGEIHVLHRSTPVQYIHSVFTMNGTPLRKEILDSDGSTPVIARSKSGNVSVTGGGQVQPNAKTRIRTFTFEDE